MTRLIDLSPLRANYYRQLNNELNPTISCQGTAMVQCLDIIFKQDVEQLKKLTPFNQPEDDLRLFILKNPDVQAFFRRSHPGSRIPAPEWADVLVYTVNKIYGSKICRFEPDITLQVISADLSSGLPIMCSMKYLEHGIEGHYVTVVGQVDDKLIIDDPYKNSLTWEPDGYHCKYSFDEFAKHSKGYGIRFST